MFLKPLKKNDNWVPNTTVFSFSFEKRLKKKKICQNLARTKTQFYNTIIIEEKIYKSNYNIHIKTQTTKSSSLFYLVRLNLPNLITF